MANIMKIASGVDVMPLLVQIERQPEVWDIYSQRKAEYGPHTRISDIWVRYNDYANYNGDLQAFNGPHDSVWYPEACKLPAVRDIVFSVMARVQGERLGGVLITRIPPGGRVEAHVDGGWHADYYSKFAVQLKSAPGQAFCFEGESLDARPGDVYWFNNGATHWVVNDTQHERMTLIVCVKGG